MNTAPPRPRQNRSFTIIFMIELWERFGYYGMAALLVLFMVEKLHLGDTEANLAWGAFTALVYAAPALGGWIGDKVLGTRRTLSIGAVVLAIGYLLLAVPSENPYLLYCAMAVIVVGNGLFKANSANMVRRIYEGDDAKIDSAFTVYYMAVNVGATVSALFTPWIKDHWGWHAAFAVCCAGMTLGLINYVAMMHRLRGLGSPPDETRVRWGRLAMVLLSCVVAVFAIGFLIQRRGIAVASVYAAGIIVLCVFGYMIARGEKAQRAGLIATIILFIEALLFFIFYQQMYTSVTLFALRNVDWNQNLFGTHLFTWQPAQYQALNAIWIMILSPILAFTYTRLGARGRDLPIAGKFAIGFLMVSVGFFIYGLGSVTAIDGKVSSWYMIGASGFYSLGELLIASLGLAIIARYVPARASGFMMGAYFVVVGISQYLGSVVATYASIPENIVDPRQTLLIYASLFNRLGFLALGGTALAIALLPLTTRLSATHRVRRSIGEPAAD